MTLTELVNAVYTLTNAPYLVNETLLAVKASTLKMHTCDYFFKDLQSGQVQFDQAAYIQQLYTQAIPFYRSMAFFKKNDPSLAAYQQNPTILPPLYNPTLTPQQRTNEIDIITPDNLWDEFGCEKLNVGYQAGGVFNIKSGTSFQYALMTYYRYPDRQDATFISWIADEYPEAIFYDAASAIFQTLGQNDVSRKYDSPGGLAYDSKHQLIVDNIVMKGY